MLNIEANSNVVTCAQRPGAQARNSKASAAFGTETLPASDLRAPPALTSAASGPRILLARRTLRRTRENPLPGSMTQQSAQLLCFSWNLPAVNPGGGTVSTAFLGRCPQPADPSALLPGQASQESPAPLRPQTVWTATGWGRRRSALPTAKAQPSRPGQLLSSLRTAGGISDWGWSGHVLTGKQVGNAAALHKSCAQSSPSTASGEHVSLENPLWILRSYKVNNMKALRLQKDVLL